jgi:hypothetical protein
LLAAGLDRVIGYKYAAGFNTVCILSLVNTILDSVKDTPVITAHWERRGEMVDANICFYSLRKALQSATAAAAAVLAGGGAFVIPYLTVYAVLPVSVVFLFLFSAASHRMSRAALFNAILVVFMAFFGGFALVLYPNADVLHPHALADQMQQVG